MTQTPAGWHPDPADASQMRYWDGTAWSDHRAPVAPAVAEPMDDGLRKNVLQQAIMGHTSKGYRVESMTDFQAQLVKGKPVNHVLHLLLTLLTCSVWGLVWLVLVVTGGESRKVVMVDDWGRLTVR